MHTSMHHLDSQVPAGRVHVQDACTTIGRRIRLNDVTGKANGEIELLAAGESMFSVGGLKLFDSSSGRIQGMQMQTFFGGE